ncbi:hypothetical protein [Nonomuraea rhodomycinica]|uniref:Uncharacterized protein n=1 Tax=Nonomuraea rhodomycinica TaxID=1712872 RepID=A0A7Y6MAQ0_9ACTN|nr:hypothetical protein [Nonomuraea rhodomycinica]NUW41448.1 hypothetical protein [Nonomuraea rhodomycinica]
MRHLAAAIGLTNHLLGPVSRTERAGDERMWGIARWVAGVSARPLATTGPGVAGTRDVAAGEPVSG